MEMAYYYVMISCHQGIHDIFMKQHQLQVFLLKAKNMDWKYYTQTIPVPFNSS